MHVVLWKTCFAKARDPTGTVFVGEEGGCGFPFDPFRIFLRVWVGVCVCVRVCVCERERERGRETDGDTETPSVNVSVCDRLG